LRRTDLDWIRIGAFALLIVYHIALFFGPWDWHLNSRHPQRWIASALVMSNPWRLGLLFFVSGAAIALMRRRTPAALLADRSRRLLVPMIFGAIVLVPPQAYAEAVAKFGETADYATFLSGYFLPGGRPRIDLPLNHLWFILYIWAYGFAAMAIVPVAPRLRAMLETGLRGGGLILLPCLYLAAVRIALFPAFGITNRLGNDWYNHASSLALFLLGYLIVDSRAIWTDLVRLRWIALAAAVASVVPLMIDATLPPPQHARAIPIMAACAINQWTTIAAILGFGHRHLRAADDGPALRYLRGGIFPFYLTHQTIIVLAAWWLDARDLPVLAEALLLVAATALGCLLAYEIGRRVPGLAPLLGIARSAQPDRRRERPRRLGG
jgi:glucan biosynthesis protein C